MIFVNLKNESLGNQDKILKDLETLLTEQKMDNFQKAKELKLWLIVLNALRKHRILTSQELQKIKELEYF